jgi:hypothetical protein
LPDVDHQPARPRRPQVLRGPVCDDPGDGPMRALVGARLDIGRGRRCVRWRYGDCGSAQSGDASLFVARLGRGSWMPFARTGPLRRRLAQTLPSRPVDSSVLRRDAPPRQTMMGQYPRCARRRPWRARSAPAASWRPRLGPRGECSAAVEVLAQLSAPSGGDPEPVLLVVDRHHPHGPSALCEEHVKAVEQPTSRTPIPARSSGSVETR